MLRRKAKRQLDSSERGGSEEIRLSKHGRHNTPSQNERNDDLEKIVFGDHFLGFNVDIKDEENVVHLNQEDNILQTELPAWVDEDDCNVRIDVSAEDRLKKFRDGGDDLITGDVLKKKLETQFTKIYGVPTWASGGSRVTKRLGEEEDDEDNEILQRAGSFISQKTDHLPKGILDINKVKDANCSKPFDAVVKCVEFHPRSKILLVAGLNNTLNIFQVDGKTNANLQTMYLKGFPIHAAHFIENGEQVILASQRRHFYCYDMVAGNVTRIPEIRGKEEKHFASFFVSPDEKYLVFPGKSGYIYLLSSKTKQWMADLKMNGSVTSIAFFADGKRMISGGSRSAIHELVQHGGLLQN